MSQLSEFWKNKNYLFSEAITYLEDKAATITPTEKATFVVQLMKAAHIAVGGVWGALLEQAVLSTIDYELAKIRARKPAPPVEASIYDTPEANPLPDDATLIAHGYKSGDVKWTNTKTNQWMITQTGGFGPAGWDQIGTIG